MTKTSVADPDLLVSVMDFAAKFTFVDYLKIQTSMQIIASQLCDQASTKEDHEFSISGKRVLCV